MKEIHSTPTSDLHRHTCAAAYVSGHTYAHTHTNKYHTCNPCTYIHTKEESNKGLKPSTTSMSLKPPNSTSSQNHLKSLFHTSYTERSWFTRSTNNHAIICIFSKKPKWYFGVHLHRDSAVPSHSGPFITYLPITVCYKSIHKEKESLRNVTWWVKGRI